MGQFKLLWINVDRTDASSLQSSFARQFQVTELSGAELHILEPESWDAICFDFDFPSMSGLRLIPDAKTRWPSAPIVMLTSQNSAELAVWALRSRVFDLLVKPANAEDVDRVIERIAAAVQARRSQMERKPQVTSAQLPAETRYHPHPGTSVRLRAALAHITKNYLRHVPESEVALLCNMSPSRFCREFKAEFGVTFVEYLASYRVIQAKRLLTNPTMSVADVASAVGFNDPSYFTRVFRKQEGVSPSEYRAGTVFRSQPSAQRPERASDYPRIKSSG